MSLKDFVFSKHLEEGEKIHYVIHRHWMIMAEKLFLNLFIGFLVPWGLYFMGFNTRPLLYLFIVWSLFASIRLFYIILDWYADAWLLTSHSIIHVEWNGVFNNLSARTTYEDVEGMTYEIKGFLGTIFRYGDVSLRSHSGVHFTLAQVASPKAVEMILLKEQEEYLHHRNMHHAEGLKELITEMLSMHVNKKLK